MNVLIAFASLIIISVLVKIIFEKKNHRLYQLLEQFPSHPVYPLIGNLNLACNPAKGLLEKFDITLQPYNRQVFWFGPLPILLLKKHDDIAAILNQCNDRDTMALGDAWYGTGVINSRYEEWKKSRRILNPAFSSEMLSKYLQVLNKNSSRYIENLKPVADTGKEVDILHRIMQVNLDSIIENILDVTIQNRGKSEQEFGDAIMESFASIFQRISVPILFPNFVYKLYTKITKKTRLMEHLKFHPSEILRQKLDKRRDCQEQTTSTVDDENGSKTVIDLLINTRLREADFTETRIREELLQIIVPAMEPPAQILSFLMLMLAINQDVQTKLYEEIAKLPTSQENIDDTLTEDDLNNRLTYLEQCIKETLRLFSSVSHDIRRTHKEITLDDKIIPANVLVVLFIYAANRDSDLYEDPLKWDPEHFSEEAVQQRPKTSDLSFGYGPRYCLGYKYAMFSMKIAMVAILRKYRLSTHLKEMTHKDLYIDLAIRSIHGYPVQFTSRSETRI